MQHDWRTLINSRDPLFLKNGSEIECAKPDGFNSRFMIYTVRKSQWIKKPFHPNGGYFETDCTYRVRDAHLITDAEVKEGKRVPIAFEAKTIDEINEWIINHRH